MRSAATRNFIPVILAAVAAIIALSGCSRPLPPPPDQGMGTTLNVSINLRIDNSQGAIEKLTEEFQKEHPLIHVNLTYMRRDEQYRKITERTNSGSGTDSLDVAMVDLIWIAELASKNLIRPLDSSITPEMMQDLYPSIKDAFIYKGRMWAMPMSCYCQILFYNQDILSRAGIIHPPETIEAWENQMETIKEKQLLTYPLIDSWSQQEALVCEYIWMTGAYGGEIFDRKGTPLFNRGAGIEALKTMIRWIQKGLVNPISLAADEALVRNMCTEGNAAFATNWFSQIPPDSSSGQPGEHLKAGLIPVARSVYSLVPLHCTSVSGFQGLAIMSGCRHPGEAWEYIRKLSAPAGYRYCTDEFPIWSSLQKEEQWQREDKNWTVKEKSLRSAHHRPRLRDYAAVSSVLQKYLHLALEQRISPQEALNRAASEISQSKYPFSDSPR